MRVGVETVVRCVFLVVHFVVNVWESDVLRLGWVVAWGVGSLGAEDGIEVGFV